MLNCWCITWPVCFKRIILYKTVCHLQWDTFQNSLTYTALIPRFCKKCYCVPASRRLKLNILNTGWSKVSVQLTQCIRTITTQLMIWRWPSQNTFGMWSVLYWTRSSWTQFGVSINAWRLEGDTLNITCNFLYCNHQVHRDFFIFCVVLCIFVLFYVYFVVLCILCCSIILCCSMYILLFYVFCVVLCISVLFHVFLCCSMYFWVVLCIFLFYVFLCCSMYFWCCSMYFCVLCIFVLFYVFLCCFMYRLFCVVLCIVCVYMCTVLLPPGGYPIAVKHIISYNISLRHRRSSGKSSNHYNLSMRWRRVVKITLPAALSPGKKTKEPTE
jgi:hypothetical protein